MDEKLIKIIQEYTPQTELKPESDFQSDLGLDSLQLPSLIVEIEDAYGISLPIPEIADIHTIKELSELIAKKRRK